MKNFILITFLFLLAGFGEAYSQQTNITPAGKNQIMQTDQEVLAPNVAPENRLVSENNVHPSVNQQLQAQSDKPLSPHVEEGAITPNVVDPVILMKHDSDPPVMEKNPENHKTPLDDPRIVRPETK